MTSYNIERVLKVEEQREIMLECDKAFSDSVVNRPDYETLVGKIYKYGIFLTIRVGNRNAGYVAFYANDTESRMAYITLICVKQEFQKMHFGKQLIEECFSESRKMGMKSIRLEVKKNNYMAIQFYYANGFEREEKESDASLYLKKEL